MSGRRRRGRETHGRTRAQDCYRNVADDLGDRPAFDSTPFDSSSGVSAWETLPTESIFKSTGSSSASRSPARPSARCPVESTAGPSQDWLSSSEHSRLVSFMNSTPEVLPVSSDHIRLSRRGPSTGGYSGTASPLLKKVLNKSDPRSPVGSTIVTSSQSSRPSTSYSSSPFSCRPDSTRSSGLDHWRTSPGASGLSGFAEVSNSASSHYSDYDENVDDDDEEFNFFSSLLSSSPQSERREPIVVDTSPLPPWKPYYASERLEDPNNPPPMFHPAFTNEWMNDPNISEDLGNFYASTVSEFSPNFGIFDYGRLSEFNTQNLYDPERFTGPNDAEDTSLIPPTPAYGDDIEVFGDPRQALAVSTDDVPEKYRKEKWHYFELKQRLEMFKKLGMESDLAMYPGALERMEADPWTGDDSSQEVQVYVRGQEGDPALDDDLLERMEALCDPNNEGLKAFHAAMANPPPIKDEFVKESSGDCDDTRRLEQLVGSTNERRREFMAAMESPPPIGPEDSNVELLSDDCGRLEERLEELVSPANQGRREFLAAMENPPLICEQSLDDSFVTCDDEAEGTSYSDTFNTCLIGDNSEMTAGAHHPLNTTFTLSGDGPNGC